MLNTHETSHAGEEFAEAGTTFQQQGQVMCQNSLEVNGAQYRKIPRIHLEGRKKRVKYVETITQQEGFTMKNVLQKSNS